MPEIQLNSKERQALKARAHELRPVVLLGNAGLSGPVMKEIDRALTAHELIKVKVPGDDRDERDSLFAEVAEALSAARVQAIGKLLVMYRPAPDEPAAPGPDKKPAASTGKRPPPSRNPGGGPRPAKGKPSAPKRSTPDRRETERVNPTSAPRRDPGAATRAAGKRNVVRRGGGRAR